MLEPVQIALSLGSNIDRYRHINAGLTALARDFGTLQMSPVYETAAVGFDGHAFLNLIVVVHSALPLREVVQRLKQIEDDNGRDRTAAKFSPRTLDIDVVTYGAHHGVLDGIELPRAELFQHAFVTRPMADLLPDQKVPGADVTFAELWQQQGDHDQQLQVVPFRCEPA